MKKGCAHHLFSRVCGATSIVERGQVVIPKEARDILETKPGDRFLVMEHDGLLVLLQEEVFAKMANTITKAFGSFPGLKKK